MKRLGSLKTLMSSIACAGLIAACGTSGGDQDPTDNKSDSSSGDDDDDDSSSSTSSDNSSTGDDDDDDETVDPPDPGADCEESEVGPRVLRRLTREEIANTLGDVFSEFSDLWGGVLMGPDSVASKTYFINHHTLKFGNQAAKDLLASAEDLATIVGNNLDRVVDCATTSPDETCAKEVIERYTWRLFRRRATSEEIKRYTDLYGDIAAKSDFKTAMKWVFVALIESPNTVYRSELGEEAGKVFELTQFELASALSYDFSASPPSTDLLDRAEKGELDSPDVLVKEAKKLLESDKGHRVVLAFFRDWLDYERVIAEAKTEIGDFVLVRDLMVKETDTFIDKVVFDQRGTVQELLSANYTWTNDSLATYYSFAEPGSSSEFKKVERDYGRGLLAQGSLMASRAHSDYTSPTQRGLLLFEKLFCSERPEPPGNIPKLPPIIPGTMTTRERYEKLHSADKACSFCHEQFDPIGFAFEHFDEGGRFREDEFGLTIDATGSANHEGEPLFDFDGQDELAQQMAASPVVMSCVSGQLADYTFAGVGSCLADVDARKKVASGDMSLVDYLASMANAPHFSTRK